MVFVRGKIVFVKGLRCIKYDDFCTPFDLLDFGCLHFFMSIFVPNTQNKKRARFNQRTRKKFRQIFIVYLFVFKGINLKLLTHSS